MVFNFVQREVPPAVQDVVKRAGHTMEEIDYFLFHQPNKFMLQKLAEQLGVPYSKVPMELTAELGNSDSGTIPAVITTYKSEELLREKTLLSFRVWWGINLGICSNEYWSVGFL